MILEIAAVAVLSAPPKTQPEVGLSTEQSSLVINGDSPARPFETFAENQTRIALLIAQLKKEKEENEALKLNAVKVSDKIKAEQEKIKELKQKIADKKEQDRIAAEQARIADELAAQQALASAQPAPQPASYARGASSGNVGNRYGWGQCTWHVYNMRPDIGSFWGNANQWLASAQNDGYSTGSVPAVGAIGVDFRGSYGHVVYITGVSADKTTVTLSEMNYGGGVGVSHTRSDSAYNYQYIY